MWKKGKFCASTGPGGSGKVSHSSLCLPHNAMVSNCCIFTQFQCMCCFVVVVALFWLIFFWHHLSLPWISFFVLLIIHPCSDPFLHNHCSPPFLEIPLLPLLLPSQLCACVWLTQWTSLLGKIVCVCFIVLSHELVVFA